MKIVLHIQPIIWSSEGTIYYASDDGQVLLSFQGPITTLERSETMEVDIPIGREEES